jgi:putative endonuclease
MAEHNVLGLKGEKLAADHLQEKGFLIQEINWRKERAEADIIAVKNDMLIFVEVKTRATEYYGAPGEAVGKTKMKMVVRAAELYLEEKAINKEVRYDIVEVIIEKGKTSIKHIEDAFYPYSNELD